VEGKVIIIMKRVTVKDIANELNISLSTINKALTGKKGVSEQTRTNVLKTAEIMGYKVNKVAQSLARKSINIGIIIPKSWPQIHNLFKHGINKEIERLSDYNVYSTYYEVSDMYSNIETMKIIEQCIKDEVSAVILCPGYYADIENGLLKLQKREIPLVILGTDIRKKFDRFTCIRTDGLRSGSMAAELLGWQIKDNSSVAVLIGNKDLKDHNDKVEGFVKESKIQKFIMAGVFEHQDEIDLSYILTKKIIREITNIKGIYVATGNSIGVCKYLEEKGLTDNISIIATDLYKEIKQYIKKGIIKATLFQNQVTQGEKAVKIIFSLLTENKKAPSEILISPSIIIKNNVDFFDLDNENS
jgi:LacI family transcriptional regulator